MGNTYFEHKSLHKYTKVARSGAGKVRHSVYVKDVRAVRGMGQSSQIII